MSKEYNQIIDSTYKGYLKKAKNQTTEDLLGSMIRGDEIIHGMLEAHTRDFIPYTREQFIDKCKTDTEFSKRWGLQIEERELSLEERIKIWRERTKGLHIMLMWGGDKTLEDSLNEQNVPTKLITVTYKDEIIEIYE
jgi:hypothetical protein